ncbi:MAG: electron transfer flavoprotein subunit alpha/FixB family protein [Planctomycetes bacterium]|nr:electron transfer flavoprotein subunit alpha/FixB family protein [Planctomycetota bacterium]
MAAVLAFVETSRGKLKKSAAEILGEGKRLAGKLGGTLDAVLVGERVTALAGEAGKLGADRVLVADAEVFKAFGVDAYLKALVKACAVSSPRLFVMAASVVGKDLGPALAAAAQSALLADVTSVAVADGKVRVEKPVYAGKAVATIAASSPMVIATLRPNVFAPAQQVDGRSAPVEVIDAGVNPGDLRAVVKEVLAKASEKLDLTEADIIVSGGRGMKGPENWGILEKLAEAVGGVLGASRAVVDAGWRPHEEQVGQTGKTVSPKLYIAVAISGAIQHLAGMRTSKCIVAINTDPEAPIFKVADYGIVGDAFEVVPVLAEELRKLRE